MAELSGLEVFALAKEIEIGLHGTYVKNVYSLGGSQVLRFGRPGGEDAWIVASPRRGVWVSRRVAERAETTSFTTRLRQELVRERFASSRQLNEDRVFDLEFGEGDASKHLVVELMPPGNVIVTDSKLRIVVAQREVRTPSRRIVKGGQYSPPAQRKRSPSDASEAEVSEAIVKESTAGAAIGRTFSLPRKYVALALSRVGVEEGAPSSSLVGREEEVAETLRSIVRQAHEDPRPLACATPDGEEIFLLAPQGLDMIVEAGTVSEVCDRVLLGAASTADEEPGEDGKARELQSTVAKLRAQREGLMAEAARLRELAGRAKAAPSAQEAGAIAASAGLDGRKERGSQASVASAVFDRAKEMEAKAKDAGKAADSLSKKAAARAEPRVRRTRELRRGKQEWYEKFRWFTTTAGRLAVGGRDSQSNTLLVRRHLEGDDTVYHADLFGSPFFVLKGGREQTDDERSEVAQATVAFSSAWKTGLGAADAYWVNPDQVSSSAPSGEFLPKGGFLIRGRKNFVAHNLVELAVGVGRDGRVVSGPEAAIRGSAGAYVVLRPHNEKSSETAKRVKKDLEALSGGEAEVSISVDDVLRMLPAGGGKVLRKYAAAARQPPRNA